MVVKKVRRLPSKYLVIPYIWENIGTILKIPKENIPILIMRPFSNGTIMVIGLQWNLHEGIHILIVLTAECFGNEIMMSVQILVSQDQVTEVLLFDLRLKSHF